MTRLIKDCFNANLRISSERLKKLFEKIFENTEIVSEKHILQDSYKNIMFLASLLTISLFLQEF